MKEVSRTIILEVCGTLSVVCLSYLYIDAWEDLRVCQEQVLKLEQQLLENKKEINNTSHDVGMPLDPIMPSPNRSPAKTIRITNDQSSHAISLERLTELANWYASSRLQDIQKYIQLKDDDKIALQDRLAQGFIEQKSIQADSTNANQSAETFEAVLRDVLGEEAAQKYHAERAIDIDALKEERLNTTSSAFSKNLALSANQEVEVRASLQALEGDMHEVHEKMGEQLAIMSPNRVFAEQDPDKRAALIAEARAMNNELIKQKREILNERLKGILTQEQMGSLLRAESLPGSLYGVPGF